MKVAINRRWWLIGLAFAGTLAAKNYVDSSTHRSTVIAAATDGTQITANRPSGRQNTLQHLELGLLHTSKNLADTSDLFRRKSWYVPPPPAPLPPPPVPVAPPLPFTFLGKVQKADGKLTLFLADKDRVYLIHGGEILAHTYHVDGIEHGKLVITYIPLKKKQYLNIMETH